ncbi:MAG: hypothetical protein MJ147_10030 [Clostridia bacterium]|nr:hypothetical protein [Clostridia bacterium]
MKRKNDVVCTFAPQFNLSREEQKELSLFIEKALVESLYKRNLLTQSQRRQCIEKLGGESHKK